MKLNIFENKTSNAVAGARLLKMGFTFLLLTQVVLAVLVLHLHQNVRTVVEFPGEDKNMEITSFTANENYLRKAAGYVVRTYLCYTSETARSQYDELLTLYAPEVYSQESLKLYKEAKDIEEAKTFSSVFTISKMFYDYKKQYIEVAGMHRLFHDGAQKFSEMQTYVIDYAVRDGRFMIRDIRKKELSS